jgi:hypothetical protein
VTRTVRQLAGFSVSSPRLRRTTFAWMANVSHCAPFCSESTISGALSFDFCVNLTTVPLPSADGSNLYSAVMSASLKSIDLVVKRFCSG